MKKTIYLHIGIGKTGTTSIQKRLDLNHKILKENNILYPLNGKNDSGHHNLAVLGEKMMSEDTISLYKDLLKEITNTNCKTIIISSENFIFMKEKYIKEIHCFLKDFNVKIVFYIREQISLIESTYLEWLKTDKLKEIRNIYDFFKIHKYSFDYYRKLKPWIDTFGEKNIKGRLFDKNIINNDVTIDFLNLLNISVNIKKLEKRENSSLIPEFEEIVKSINDNKLNHIDRNILINEILFFSNKYKKYSNKRLLSDDFIKEIKETYKESNLMCSTLFLSKEESILLIN